MLNYVIFHIFNIYTIFYYWSLLLFGMINFLTFTNRFIGIYYYLAWLNL